MRDKLNEHTANLALSQAPLIGRDMTIGIHFDKPAIKRLHSKPEKRGMIQTFRNLFKTGAIK